MSSDAAERDGALKHTLKTQGTPIGELNTK